MCPSGSQVQRTLLEILSHAWNGASSVAPVTLLMAQTLTSSVSISGVDSVIEILPEPDPSGNTTSRVPGFVRSSVLWIAAIMAWFSSVVVVASTAMYCRDACGRRLCLRSPCSR